ncbi:MAG TPA: TonB-dependent receptor [Hyphomonadaceae bacterium]|nr:TonB-dependent receptor [Hyphomonadaceae bacterium]
MNIAGISRAALLAGILATPVGLAVAQTTTATASPDRDTVFILGRIDNGITSSDGETVNASSVSAEEMRKYDRASVDEALDLIPGANASNTGGSRNERLIFVRGFDRFQTTLSIDGVRVFLPADNRIDFARFLTADLAEVQVSKGYVSVLNGPGGIGGAVNLVTRKPSRPFEAELAGTTNFNDDFALNAYTVSGLIGTRQDQFYVQLSGATTDRRSWSLSSDFVPVVASLENGNKRENSASEDWRVNFKAGWTPNATDEYAISYIKQSGEKNAPLHISDTASTRYWTWPYWDIESVYFLSRTQLGDNLQLRSRVYYNMFENLLSSFDTAAQNTQTLPRAFNSYYDDTAYGANVTLEAKLSDTNTLTGSLHYRNDEHNEQQDGFTRTPATGSPSANRAYSEPWQGTTEDTYSFALEDVQKLGPNLDLVLGASYDWTKLKSATDVNVSVTGTTIANSQIVFTPVNYPLRDMEGVNAQAALIWQATDAMKVHTSISSRVRFPTLFERFSSRFGTAIPNPDVDPERSTNFEVGTSVTLAPNVKLEGAVFYSKVQDALVQIPVVLAAPFGTVNQTRNLGDANYYGLELSLNGRATDWLDLGGNFTWTQRDYDQVGAVTFVPGTTAPITGADPTNANFEPQGVPGVKAFVYANIQALPNLTITPNIEAASSRWTVTSSSAITPPRFYKTGEYVVANLAVDWAVSDSISLLATARNLTDANYTLVDGFPEEGRNYTLGIRWRN